MIGSVVPSVIGLCVLCVPHTLRMYEVCMGHADRQLVSAAVVTALHDAK